MESDLRQHHHHHLNDHQLQQHQRQLNSSLTRYQSAPSSYFSSFLDRELCEDILKGPSSPETERIFAKFLSSTCGNTESNIPEHNLGLTRQQSPVREKMMEPQQPRQIIPQMNNQSAVMQQQQTFSSAPQSFYQSQPQQNLQTQNSGPEMDYRVMSSVGIDRFTPMKMNTGGTTSNLIRHSSSPAGLFSNINIENGYVVMKSMGDYGVGNNTNREASYPSAGRPPQPVSSGQMSPIADMGNTNNNESFDQSRSNNYSSGFPIDSWNDSTMISENMGGMQRLREDDRTLSGFSEAETENVDAGNRPPPLLAHHLSLPKDISTIEKLLQFQDSVPCKIRAKRGCATHPRSIAERVRRTKISERMRKLQDLVPNMDKQTNTADMLDLAVDYVKELQQQVKALSDKRAKCTCANKEQP